MNKILYILLLLSIVRFTVHGQAINTEFGKNRVQYHDNFNDWWKYETQNFITYWYGKGRNIAQSVIQLSELDHDEIQSILEHRINDKIEIIVYVDISDLKQSNIGIEDAFTNKSKKTKVVGNKIFVYFDGNHQNLRKQIRKGIANVYLNSILLGSNFQDFVHNAILLNLPEWYVEGLISYAGSPWDHEIDDEVRDIFYQDEKYFKFNKFAQDYPKAAGHSFWFYINQKYGKSSIANIIYLTRINRQIESSFKYLLGERFEDVALGWSQFYQSYFRAEENKFEPHSEELELKNKKWIPVSKLKISPNGKHLAYAINDLGRYKVYVKNLETNEEKMIFKSGVKNIFQETDYEYPLFAWHPRYPELTIIHEKRDILYLRRIDLNENEYEEESIPENFQRIHSLEYINPEEFLFSAETNGYSNLYVYKTKSRSDVQLTEDFYNDLDASYIKYNGELGVLFSSNRTNTNLAIQKLDTILPIENFDLFFLKLGDKYRNNELLQLTKTPNSSERQAKLASDGKIVYLDSKSGITNRYILDEGRIYPNSNKDRNIIIHDINPSADRSIYSYYRDGTYKIFVDKPELSRSQTPYITQFQKGILKNNPSAQLPLLNFKDSTKTSKIPEGKLFQTPFEDENSSDATALQTELRNEENEILFEKYFSDYYSDQIQEGKRVIKFNPVRASAARRMFRLFDPKIRMDNEPLFDGLQSYIGENRQLQNIPVGVLFQAQVKDLFEDYNFTGGVRFPFTFNGSEYFLVFDRRKKLLDHRIAFYRRTRTQNDRPDLGAFQKSRSTSLLGLYRISYPFDIYRSLRLTTTLRFDTYFFQATDAFTFTAPRDNQKRIFLRAEYIYDNSFDVNINVKNGTRYKFFAEIINRFSLELTNNSEFDLSEGVTAVFGYDARHYIPFWRHAVLALRSSGGTSIGAERMLYYVGGVENWIAPKFDESIPFPSDGDFAYNVLAPMIRGFQYNIRNGSNYFVNTAEVRLPIFQLLGANKLRLAFLKNMQFVGFFDAGLAWFGLSPYSEENELNTVVLESPPAITTTVEYFRDPMVYGYGFGVRTTLFGYYLKLDYAWGVDTRTVQDPRLYFSLGYDF